MIGEASADLSDPRSRPGRLPVCRGRPNHVRSTPAWLLAGAGRQRWGALVALVCSWSGVWLAAWVVLLSAVLGVILTAIGTAVGDQVLSGLTGSSTSAGVASITLGGIWGAISGFLGALGGLAQAPVQFLIALLAGAAIAVGLLGVMVAAEGPWLWLRGCRRMTRDESDRLVPLLETAAVGLGLVGVPPLLISEAETVPAAHAGVRHLVVSATLLEELGDEPLLGILAHELHHWAQGDVVGERFVFACALPVALLYDLGWWLSQAGSFVAMIGWFFLWPAWLLSRLVIRPVVGVRSRQLEYQADAAVRAAGHGAALARALRQLGDFECGRSGWEAQIAANHPYRALRLEALEGQAEAEAG